MSAYRLDARTVPDTDQWVDLMDSRICPLDYRQPSQGRLESQETDEYHLGHWRSDAPSIARRTSQQIRRDSGTQWYQFMLVISGSVLIEHDGEVIHAGPGSLAPFPTGTPLTVSTTPFALINMRLSRSAIDDRINPSGGPLDGWISTDKGPGRIAAGMLYSVYRERAELTEHQFNTICDQLASLLCLSMQGDTTAAAFDHLGQVGDRVRRYIRHNAGNPNLNLRQVATDLGWSTRQIQAALQHKETSYRDLVREARLHAARDHLADPAYSHLSITEVAAASGLSLRRLSSAFKAQFGESPREFRCRKHHANHTQLTAEEVRD